MDVATGESCNLGILRWRQCDVEVPSMAIERFSIPDFKSEIVDLRERLGRTRWPEEASKSGWEYGIDVSFVKELCAYWRERFDWHAQVERLSAFHHFRCVVDGMGIHFIHERGKGPDPLPLIMTHGWPGSFLEMLQILPLLTDPEAHGADAADSFDVVVPSMPGYGFSDRRSNQ